MQDASAYETMNILMHLPIFGLIDPFTGLDQSRPLLLLVSLLNHPAARRQQSAEV